MSVTKIFQSFAIVGFRSFKAKLLLDPIVCLFTQPCQPRPLVLLGLYAVWWLLRCKAGSVDKPAYFNHVFVILLGLHKKASDSTLPLLQKHDIRLDPCS